MNWLAWLLPLAILVGAFDFLFVDFNRKQLYKRTSEDVKWPPRGDAK